MIFTNALAVKHSEHKIHIFAISLRGIAAERRSVVIPWLVASPRSDHSYENTFLYQVSWKALNYMSVYQIPAISLSCTKWGQMHYVIYLWNKCPQKHYITRICTTCPQNHSVITCLSTKCPLKHYFTCLCTKCGKQYSIIKKLLKLNAIASFCLLSFVARVRYRILII